MYSHAGLTSRKSLPAAHIWSSRDSSLQEAADVFVAETVLVEELSQLSVFFSDPPRCHLDFCCRLYSLQLA